jgi:hypothetical protein
VIEYGAEDAALDHMGADGAFIVTVAGVRCGVEATGPIELRRRDRRRLCLVGVVVENAGREARLLDGGAQRAVDAHGRAYSVVGRAAAFLNERAPSLLDAIPGGATVRGVLPFEVPARTHLVALLIHESAAHTWSPCSCTSRPAPGVPASRSPEARSAERHEGAAAPIRCPLGAGPRTSPGADPVFACYGDNTDSDTPEAQCNFRNRPVAIYSSKRIPFLEEVRVIVGIRAQRNRVVCWHGRWK